ncbi:MAG: class I SAM-dependent methyltransferase [Acidobacteriota bacterium]
MSQHHNDLLNVTPIWNQTAADYHEFISAHDSYVQQIERPAVTAIATTLTFRRVLDLGCGSGHYACWFARRGAFVTGLDLSRQMLLLAHAQATAGQLALNLCEGDIRRSWPFADNSFELVFSGTALHYIEDLAAFFHQAYRVLVPGGHLLISALHPVSVGLFPTLTQDYRSQQAWNLKYFDTTRRHYFAPWSMTTPETENAPPPIECYHHTLEQYLGAILEAGFLLRTLREPAPPAELATENPARYSYSFTQPLFLVMHAQRQ